MSGCYIVCLPGRTKQWLGTRGKVFGHIHNPRLPSARLPSPCGQESALFSRGDVYSLPPLPSLSQEGAPSYPHIPTRQLRDFSLWDTFREPQLRGHAGLPPGDGEGQD